MNELIKKESPQVVRFVAMLDRVLAKLESFVGSCKPPLNGEVYLSDREVAQRLKISRRTLQEWRNSGRIGFVQFDGKIIYPEAEIERLLKVHWQPAWEE